ncbi:pilus assembly protein CpaC [Rhodopseudomonas palustris]|uniref:Pilus assembly protein CpaC n=1 Tax=Rhodopseudomonas palustris TaxID=1076 RepID=A0A323UDQ2_RHOPL|nr:pilus assembly protein N-terminal domain-containing protein [Rhodopseudomonas palustris]PZA09106.1 pilus assembly protein CpaC [Rhodopseudomonas palustris]
MSSFRFARRFSAVLFVPSLLVGLCSAPAIAGTEDSISVSVDQAKLIKLPQDVATIVVGNPLIADVSLQPGGMVVITGKGYGATNVIAMDRKGMVVADRVIQVEGPADKVVTVYRGTNRESYSCAPICERRMTLGDSEAYFKSTMEQAGKLNEQASSASVATRAN